MDKNTYRNDMLLGIGIVILGIVYLCLIPFEVSSQSESGGLSNLISGRTLPVVIALAMIILGGILALSSKKECQECLVKDRSNMTIAEKRARNKRVIIYIGAILLYLIAINIFSFVISSVFFLFFAMTYSGCVNKTAIVVTSILAPIFVYFIFSEAMMMPMPDSYIIEYLQSININIAI